MHTEQSAQTDYANTPGEDILDFGPHYEKAGAGKRFLNYLIDLIVFYILVIVFGIVLELLSPGTVDRMTSDNSGFDLIDRIAVLAIYAIYMSLVEALLKGKSLGKFITQTRAVNLDGSRISAKTAFTRGFSRAVPFCVFSALGTPCNPWQDRWTNTMVIDEKKTTVL